jgi:D-beta-D-heptose 7-phosphate kinase/D-beta-D-heptose 1-phosphate adenosyltransferase
MTGIAADSIVKAMEGRAVLVVGDIMLDRFVTGAVTRLSPEAPVPVLAQESQTQALGGAGNVLANLAGLGVTAHVLAIVGDDAPGRAVAAIIKTLGADGAGLLVDAGRPTTVKTRFMAGHHHILRVDEEKSGPVDDVMAARILKHAESVMPQVHAVILSDYGKGVLTPAIIAAVIKMARARNIPVLVDPKGADYARYAGATAVTPNRAELALAAGTGALKSDADIVSAAQAVIKKSGVGAVIATRSEDGITVIAETVTHIPTVKLPVFDVAGAGDTVIATVAAALAAGARLEDAARLANRAGGIVVGKPGTAAITAGELSARVQGGALTRDAAAMQVRLWQSQGLRVGFTNGCFDILHIGHVTYLAQARGRCDRLVVAVNADESVKRLKGPTRPVNDTAARAGVLAALGCVDMVVVFGDVAADDDKPCVILDTLRPDVIFKGGDYTEDQLPEAKIVRAYGGDVQIMAMVDGYSTTGTIAKMKA